MSNLNLIQIKLDAVSLQQKRIILACFTPNNKDFAVDFALDGVDWELPLEELCQRYFYPAISFLKEKMKEGGEV